MNTSYPICVIIFIMGISSVAHAQSPITMDGTTGVGTGINQNFANIAGANQTITINGDGLNANGTRNGANIFFSFSQFGITAGDTALFQCPNGCAGVTNVISRVTGTSASNFDGTLSTTIGQISAGSPATFWFFNPNGVVGSVVTTPPSYLKVGDKADKVIFNNGAVFGLTTDPNLSTLGIPVGNFTNQQPSAVPQSFGYPPPPTITITNNQIITTPVPVVEIPAVIEVAPVVDNTPVVQVVAPVVRQIPADAVNATLVKNPVLTSVEQKKLSPCAGDNKSSLISTGVANYIPPVSLQAPYSLVPKAAANAKKTTPATSLNESDKCR
jgi:filamentous hemagglutinin family protein